MSLGQPDLYIGGELMQTAAADPRPALAGLRLGWGNDSRLEMDPPSTLAGQFLIKGTMPAFLEVGAPVGLVDPVSARCLFAGNLGPLRAAPDDSVRDALRVSFTAASPLAELVKHKVLDVAWDANTPAATRFGTLAAAMPRGWTLTGSTGHTWINQTKQQYKAKEWLQLAERFCRSYTYRYHDTSYYTPGAGLSKRITFSPERGKILPPGGLEPAGERGLWSTYTPGGASGVAVLPNSGVRVGVEWEKTPEDMITDVQVSTFQATETDADKDSTEFEFAMSLTPFFIDNSALQDAYGYRQVKIETSLSAFNASAIAAQGQNIVNYWLDTENKWRPTGLQLPDSRVLDTDPLLNLLAVDTRGTAALAVPDADLAPGLIQSFVMAGQATWTGKKWLTDITLGRTL
jgi:hypothetical protein